MPWYDTGGTRLWYEDHGAGRPLVLLHGWCMSSAVWRFQFEGLAGSYRVIAPDLAGHGRSGPSGAGYTLEGFSADVAALFHHLDLGDALLGGWSMGGQVALEACGHLTERLAGLVLISATPRFTASEDFPWGLAPVEAQGMAVKLRRNAQRALEGFKGRMFASDELTDPTLAAKVQALLDDVPIPETGAALESLEALAEADQRALLPPIGLPTLVINGEHDRICLPGASDYLGQRIRFSSRQVMAGCGHAPFLTRSREFDACLVQFGRRVREHDR